MESIKMFFTKRTTIVALIATVIAGLAVHFYKFTNTLPNWDSMYLIRNSIEGMSQTGRWFSGISANLLSSAYSLPWVLGLLSIVFLALIVALLVDLFEIQKTFYIILTAVLLVTFPSVAANFAYMEWADVYLLSFLLSVLAVYLCVRQTRFFVLPAILLSLSMGIYRFTLAPRLSVSYCTCLKSISWMMSVCWHKNASPSNSASIFCLV